MTYDPFEAPQNTKAPPTLTPLEGSLKDLDLDKELFTQYAKAKNLLQMAEFDDQAPLNQKVLAMNSIVAILGQIVKMQEALYNVKQNALMETTLIDTLKAHPELKEAFLKDYRTACKA